MEIEKFLKDQKSKRHQLLLCAEGFGSSTFRG
jgi:hypothetical protein